MKRTLFLLVSILIVGAMLFVACQAIQGQPRGEEEGQATPAPPKVTATSPVQPSQQPTRATGGSATATDVPMQEVVVMQEPAIESVTQLTSGDEALDGWTDPNATVLTGFDLGGQAHTLLGGMGTADAASYIQYLHGDPATITVFDRDGETVYDQTFSAAFLVTIEMCQGTRFEITGYAPFDPNQGQGHFPIWSETFVVPAEVSPTTAAMYIQWLFGGTSGDPQIDANAAAYAVQYFGVDASDVPNWRGKDPTVNHVHVPCTGNALVIKPAQ